MSWGVPDKRKAQCRVTPRDISLLTSLAENQLLTTSQIQAQYFPSIHRARKRLNQLWWSGFVQRVKIPPGLELLSAEAVYSIARAGLRLLQAQGRHQFGWTVPKPPKRPGSLMFLSHTLLRNSFRIALENSVHQDSSVGLCDWKHDGSLAQSVLVPNTQTQALQKVVLKADAYFRLRKNEREVEFYLEIDNGTMALTRLVEKLKAYRIWQLARRSTEGGRQREDRVLVLLFSSNRTENLVSRLSSQFTHRPVNPLWLIAYANRTSLISTDVLKDLRWTKPENIRVGGVSLTEELQMIRNGQNVPK